MTRESWLTPTLQAIEDWWRPPEYFGANRLTAGLDLWGDRWKHSRLGRLLGGWINRFSSHSMEDDLEFHAWLLRWQTWLGLLLTLGLAGVGAYYGRHAYLQWRDGQLALEAQALLTEGQLEPALFRARLVWSRQPDDLRALRVLAEAAGATGNSNALDWASRVVALNPDVTNQLLLARLALQVEPPPCPTAAKALQSVPAQEQPQADFQRLAARLALRTGQTELARTHFQQLIQLEPTNWVNQLELAAAELHSTNSAEIQDAQASLDRLSTQPDSRLPALRLRVETAAEHHDWAEAERLSSQIVSESKATLPDHLLHLTFLQNLQSDRFQQAVTAAEALAGTDAAAVGELAAWLNGHHWPQLTVQWLTNQPPGFQRHGLLPSTLADAFVRAEQWPALERFLNQGPWPDCPALREAFLARAARQLNKPTDAEAAWVTARDLAATSPESLRRLAGMVAAWNWPDRHEELLWLTAEKYPEQRWAPEALHQMAVQQADTRRLWRLAKILYVRHPQHDRLASDYAAYALLVDEDPRQARKIAAEIFQRHPEDPTMVTTHALAELEAGNTNAALAAFKPLPPEVLEVPAVAAYYGVTLAVTGDAAAAKRYLDRAAQARLLPEQKRLVTVAQANPAQLLTEWRTGALAPRSSTHPHG